MRYGAPCSPDRANRPGRLRAPNIRYEQDLVGPARDLNNRPHSRPSAQPPIVLRAGSWVSWPKLALATDRAGAKAMDP